MSFSKRLYIDKVITKEPEDIEEWLQRFIEIILNNNSDSKDKAGKDNMGREKEKSSNGSA